MLHCGQERWSCGRQLCIMRAGHIRTLSEYFLDGADPVEDSRAEGYHGYVHQWYHRNLLLSPLYVGAIRSRSGWRRARRHVYRSLIDKRYHKIKEQVVLSRFFPLLVPLQNTLRKLRIRNMLVRFAVNSDWLIFPTFSMFRMTEVLWVKSGNSELISYDPDKYENKLHAFLELRFKLVSFATFEYTSLSLWFFPTVQLV